MKYEFNLSDNSSIFLDFIRALAIQMVVFGHGINFTNIFHIIRRPNTPYMQNIGVVLFFLISGFLISHTSFKKMNDFNYSFKKYFIDRFSRIYCSYLPIIILILIIDSFYFLLYRMPDINNSFNIITFIGNLLMLQDPYPLFIKITSFGTARPFWCLAIFWWLYMVFGWILFGYRTIKNKKILKIVMFFLFMILFLIILGPRKNTKIILVTVWASGIIFSSLLNYVNSILVKNTDHNIYKIINPIKNWTFSLLTKLYNSQKLSFILSIIFFVLSCIRITAKKRAYDFPFAFLITIAIFLLIVVLNNSNFKVPIKIKKIIRLFAQYSFTLYLIHYTIYSILLIYKSTMSPYLLFLLGFVISNILSLFIAYFTEMKHDLFKKFLLEKINSYLYEKN